MVILSVMSAQKDRGGHRAGVGVRSGRGSLWPERLGDKAGDGRVCLARMGMQGECHWYAKDGCWLAW